MRVLLHGKVQGAPEPAQEDAEIAEEGSEIAEETVFTRRNGATEDERRAVRRRPAKQAAT